MATLKVHPSCLELDPLSEAEYAKLESSIIKHGCRVPAIVWPQLDKPTGQMIGWIVDGNNRYLITQKHKKPLPTVEIDVPDEASAIAIGQSLNDDRRHRTSAQRAARVKLVAKARIQGKTFEQIAKELKISKTQVKRDSKVTNSPPGPKPAPENAGSESNGKPGTREIGDEPPEETIEQEIARINSAIESFCRGLMKYVDENLPADHWLNDMNRREGAIRKFRDGCETLRSCKCSGPCPRCEGTTTDGESKCRPCHGTGRLPKMNLDAVS